MRSLFVLWMAGTLACASTPRGAPPTMAPSQAVATEARHEPVRPACSTPKAALLQRPVLDAEAPWAQGSYTFGDLILLRKTIVQIADFYWDRSRIQPPRMLAAALEELARVSDDALVWKDNALATSTGKRWGVPDKIDSIWQIPLALKQLSLFIDRELPAGHRLRRGAFAEVVATNAILASLDPYSWLTPPGGIASIPAASVAEARKKMETRPELNTLADGAVQVKPGFFSTTTTSSFIRQGLASAKPAAGIILDLRGSSGGYVDATTEIIDLFLSSGRMLTLNGRDFAEPKTAADDKLASEQQRLIVLIDSRTSAGAELVAGALRFNGRAILVGEPTAGAALIQVFYDYPGKTKSDEHSSLGLSIAEAILPGDLAFNGVGIAPDVATAALPASGCAPVGDTAVSIPGDALTLATRILQQSASASRADLIAAAKSLH